MQKAIKRRRKPVQLDLFTIETGIPVPPGRLSAAERDAVKKNALKAFRKLKIGQSFTFLVSQRAAIESALKGTRGGFKISKTKEDPARVRIWRIL
jgi:hypothetical protein